MALEVKPLPGSPPLTVGNNNGGSQTTVNPQGNNYSPQQTAPASYVQPTYNPQPSSPSPAQQQATAAQVQAAAEAARVAIAAEIARQKQLVHDKKQGEVNTAAVAAKYALQVKSIGKPSPLAVRAFKSPYKFDMPVVSEFDEVRNKAYEDALKEIDSRKHDNSKTGLSALWDKISFGDDRRQSSARAYADKKLNEYIAKRVDEYSKQVDQFTKDQASKRASVENAKFTSQEQLDSAIKAYNDWENKTIAALEHDRAEITGQQQGYAKASTAPISTGVATVVGWFNDKVVNSIPGHALGQVWKYTLGSGSEDVPSIVSAPSRVINWLGNVNTPDRNIYQTGGTSINRQNTAKNAWQAGYNQRNFNIRPVTDLAYDKSKAWSELKNTPQNFSVQEMELQRKFKAATSDAERDSVAKIYWDERNRERRNYNSALEFAADPLNILTAAGKVVGESGRFAETLGKVRAGEGFLHNAVAVVDKVNELKTVTKAAISNIPGLGWLNKEYKTPAQSLADARQFAQKTRSAAQEKFFDRINQLNKKLAGSGGKLIDDSVFADLRNLTDSEAKVLQRTVDGKLSALDRAKLAGRELAPIRDKIETIAKKWTQFTEDLKIADQVGTTRFGAGKKLYSPNSYYGREAADNTAYDFFKQKKGHYIQSSSDFLTGATDRYFGSKINEIGNVAKNTKIDRWVSERSRLIGEYDKAVNPAEEFVKKAEQRATSPLNKIRTIVSTPTRVWKQSVLKFLPSWAVNNEIYNTGAAALSGGFKGIEEKIKMMNPTYFREAMDESRHLFGGNMGRELGGSSKLDKFYNAQEDWSRVAAGRAAMKGGKTEQEALDRVNKYFGDFKIKNYERPLKAVLPFYSFQKTIAKAAFTMPFDRPLAAEGLHKLDQYQHNQYDVEFNKIAPDLKKLGYTDEEISGFKEQNRKYFDGRLKIGNNWYTTPFNAFTDKKFQDIGTNPFLAAAGETATGKDRFGTQLTGQQATWQNRLISKFPQAKLAQTGWNALQVAKGNQLPRQDWIGQAGSDGYGLPKERQGFNAGAPNYDSRLDPRSDVKAGIASFLGAPSSLKFNPDQIVKEKTLQKATSDYFALNTKNMSYPDAEAARQAVFKKYGISADDFYKGILSKYDNDTSTHIKELKAAAGFQNKKLFDEYAAQPLGSRGVWADQKLRELTNNHYFDKNPFLASFDFVNPKQIDNSNKKVAYDTAKKSGNWASFNQKYGTGKSVASKHSQFTADGKYFKTAQSRDAYLSFNSPKNVFWRQYFDAPVADRKKLLAAHPQFNDRLSWTQQQWDDWKKQQAVILHAKVASWNGGNTGLAIQNHIAEQLVKAGTYSNIVATKHRKPSIKWALKA